MKEELEQIAISLAKWCKKYNKSYATMFFLEDAASAWISKEDKDYEKCSIYLCDKKLGKILNEEEK